MVNVVSMAHTSRSDEALSADGAAIAKRRWFLVGAALLAPIAVGALITVVLYMTRAQPVVTQAPAEVATTDIKGHDGAVLVIQPKTIEQVRIPLGSAVEVVLLPGVGETVESANPDILTAPANPPCHLTAICGFSIW